MASKHKSQNMNKHKSRCIKKPYYSLRPAFANDISRRDKEFVYVALDSNIIIRIAEMIEGRPLHNSNEYNNLISLLKNCAFDINGNLSKNGRIVMVVLPTVYEELKNRTTGQIRETISDLINSRFRRILISTKHQSEFEKKVSVLLKGYNDKDLFLKNGVASCDGKIEACSAFFNLTLITEDGHFGVYNKTIFEKIKFVNRRKLPGGHNGIQSETLSLKDFMKRYVSGEKFSKMENSDFLTEECKESLSSIKNASKSKANLTEMTY